jgi:hypothetical protein
MYLVMQANMYLPEPVDDHLSSSAPLKRICLHALGCIGVFQAPLASCAYSVQDDILVLRHAAGNEHLML